MADVINVHDFKTHYSTYLAKVAGGEEVLLGKHGKVIAKVVPLPAAQQPRVAGALKGKVWTSDDFDAPLGDLWSSVEAK